MSNVEASIEEDISVLATQYIPNPEESRAIRARLERRRDQIRDIEIRIPESDSETGELCSRRKFLQLACSIGEALLSPVRTLPEEIHAEIFIRAIPWPFLDSSSELQYRRYSEEPSPHAVRRNISLVCRRWQSIVYSTPGIWTRLEFPVPRASAFDANENVLKQWLESSKSCPLDIFVSPTVWPPSWDQDPDSALIKMIGHEMGRIRYFIGRPWSADDLTEIVPRGTCVNASVLEKLPLGLISQEQRHEIGKIHCPKLEMLSLHGIHALDLFTLPSFTRLRQLRINTWDAVDPFAKSIHYLFQCPQLEVLHVIHGGSHERNTPTFKQPPTRVSLLSLIQLSFEIYGDPGEVDISYLAYLFDCLYVPKLKTLEFTSRVNGDPRYDYPLSLPTLPFVIALGGSAVSLRRLHVKGLVLTGDGIGPFLYSFANLDTLHFSFCDLDQDAISALMPKSSSAAAVWACPRLTKLEFERYTIPGNDLVRLISGRTRSNTEGPFRGYLELVRIHNCAGVEPHRLAELKALARTRAAGTLVEIL